MPTPKSFLLRRSALALVALAVAFGLWKWISHPRAYALRLTDGTEVYFRSGTTIDPAPGYPRPREIRVNGNLFLRASETGEPLVVRSRLMTLTVTGNAALRVTAFATQTGEEAEVLRGRVVARKAYPSSNQEPDTLTRGEMIMINRTIDLAEKETCDPEEVQRWADELIDTVGR